MINKLAFVFALYFVFCGSALADGARIFIDIPKNITSEEAISTLKSAAFSRKWQILDHTQESLKIYIKQRIHKSELSFFVEDNVIKYTDTTEEFYRYTQKATNSIRKGWKPSVVPDNWIANLKRDFNALSYIKPQNRQARLTVEDAKERLKGLKSLFEEGLITQEEYGKKKQEILSNY